MCEKGYNYTHSCESCGKDVHAAVGINNESDEGYGDRKYFSAKVGDNVCISIPDVDEGRSDPRSVVAIVVDGSFYKKRTEHDVLKQLYSRSVFYNLHEKLLTLESLDREEKSLRTVASSQSLTGGKDHSRCNFTTNYNIYTNHCKCVTETLFCN